MSMIITKISDEQQLDSVVELANIIWHEHFTPIIGKAQVEYMLEKFQSKASVTEQIRNGFVYFLLIDNEKKIGYVAFIIKDKELFLSKFYILADKRNKGFGKQVIKFIVQVAKEYHVQKISLTVNKNNEDSIKTYQKLGFINLSSVVQDIGAGFVMDDFKMEKLITSS